MKKTRTRRGPDKSIRNTYVREFKVKPLKRIGKTELNERKNKLQTMGVNTNHLSKRTHSKKVVDSEVKKIQRRVVLPKYSKLSPYNCQKKRREVRRDYFAMKGSGRGARINMIHKNRFTVRC